MSGFSASWLALRQPYDRVARNVAVLAVVDATMRRKDKLRILDLACGAGASVGALSGRSRAAQAWRLVDKDAGLLALAARLPLPPHVAVETALRDLSRDMAEELRRPLDLVTVSALLDLVSEAWLAEFVAELARRAIPLYAALTYDGRMSFDPSDPLDEEIVAAVNVHQRGDKGFGPSLGPTAAAAAIGRLDAAGFHVTHGASDWHLGPQDRAIQTALLDGAAAAAWEAGRPSARHVASWLAGRRDAVAAGRSAIRVGHVDFVAVPSGTR